MASHGCCVDAPLRRWGRDEQNAPSSVAEKIRLRGYRDQSIQLVMKYSTEDEIEKDRQAVGKVTEKCSSEFMNPIYSLNFPI